MNVSTRVQPVAGEVLRLRLEARGTVQGVGFRPHAYRTAMSLQLAGRVCNHGAGVTIEVEGSRAPEFEALFRATLPPLAKLDDLQVVEIPVTGGRRFVIERSELSHGNATVPADVAICDHCLKELFDPGDRRYGHPFIACCDCGPRYTMTRRLPYDRGNTTMAAFPLCSDCSREYRDAYSRRLHAEPIGCHHCGPTLSSPIETIAEALRDGRIVAIKGIGGYHLACDARNADAVARLRTRKRRDGRPFAVMMLNSASAERQLRLDDGARASLESAQRPVVIADRGPGFDLPDALAPDLSTLGIMLPYTAVHYLLFHALAGRPDGRDWLAEVSDLALVMTSANISGEPMLVDDDEARERLASVADLIISHTRLITHGCDDSVLRSTPSGSIMVRRGRGFAPGSMDLGFEGPAVLALGAHLKNTVCATRGDRAHLSPHIGDLDAPSMQALLNHSARELQAWLRIVPEAIACDLHPDYASSRLAQRLAEQLQVPLLTVQHHHAHIAAVVAAHDHQGPVLGLALDGHGMGADGGSWGGELLRVDGTDCQRLGHLRPLPLPGGDRAAREPWRLATAVARALDRTDALPQCLRDRPLFDAVAELSVRDECPVTTACGRYFDAAAALLGLCHTATYEAEAPMRLEGRSRGLASDRDLFAFKGQELDLYPLLGRLLETTSAEDGASLFHSTLLQALEDWIDRAAEAEGITTVALGGGCFLNSILASALPDRLRRRALTVLTGWDRLTPGDGSISLGQAWVAARAFSESADNSLVSVTPTNLGGFH